MQKQYSPKYASLRPVGHTPIDGLGLADGFLQLLIVVILVMINCKEY